MSLSNTDSHVSALRISTESLERMVAKEVAFLCPIVVFFLLYFCAYNGGVDFCVQWSRAILYLFIHSVFRRFCVIFANLICCFMYLLHFQVEEETRKAVVRRWKHKV